MKMTWLFLLLTAVGFAATTTDSAPRLRLDLADGSRLFGTTELANIPLDSESMGVLKIPVTRIAAIKFRADQKAVTLTLTNGDRLEGKLTLTTVPLSTLFGPVRVPVEQLRAIQIGVEPGGHALQLRAANRNYVEFPASAAFDVTENWTIEF